MPYIGYFKHIRRQSVHNIDLNDGAPKEISPKPSIPQTINVVQPLVDDTATSPQLVIPSPKLPFSCPSPVIQSLGTQAPNTTELILYHAPLRFYVCAVCHFFSAQQWTVVKHIEEQHQPQKYAIIAPLNDQDFTKNSQLFRCPECSYTTSMEFLVKIHYRNKHGLPEETRWLDPTRKSESKLRCDAQSSAGSSSPLSGTDSRGSALKRQFTCPFCQKVFRTNSHVVDHIRIHTGDKPHKCSICSKAFAKKGDLNFHLATHSVEKPYRCEACGKAYASMARVRNHKWHAHLKPFRDQFSKK